MTPAAPLSQAPDQALEIKALKDEVKWRREREMHLAILLGMPDGGQYRNDWDARLTAILAEVQTLRIAAARADGALVDTNDYTGVPKSMSVLATEQAARIARLEATLADHECRHLGAQWCGKHKRYHGTLCAVLEGRDG